MEGYHESLVRVVVGPQLHPHQPWEQTCISRHHSTEHGDGLSSPVPARAGLSGTGLQPNQGTFVGLGAHHPSHAPGILPRIPHPHRAVDGESHGKCI